jgi:hypothetical protein
MPVADRLRAQYVDRQRECYREASWNNSFRHPELKRDDIPILPCGQVRYVSKILCRHGNLKADEKKIAGAMIRPVH